MPRKRSLWRNCVLGVFILGAVAMAVPVLRAQDTNFARDPNQPIDQAYTKKIRKYTTEPYFTSPLVNYLPASKTVPTPEAVLSDVAGAPKILPYAEQVYQYMRMLAKASPRVRVYTIGHTEEGREMIAVAVSSAENLEHLQQNRALSRSWPIRARSTSTTRWPSKSRARLCPSTTSPARSIRPKPVRRPH